MIFDAECISCGKRMGIELPGGSRSDMAYIRCLSASYFNRCACGGRVEVYYYQGKLDAERRVVL